MKKYTCSICKLDYAEVKYATACYDWCNNNNSCNLEITAHAIPKSKTKETKSGGVRTTVIDTITAVFVALCPICYALPILIALGIGSFASPFAEYGHNMALD